MPRSPSTHHPLRPGVLVVWEQHGMRGVAQVRMARGLSKGFVYLLQRHGDAGCPTGEVYYQRVIRLDLRLAEHAELFVDAPTQADLVRAEELERLEREL